MPAAVAAVSELDLVSERPVPTQDTSNTVVWPRPLWAMPVPRSGHRVIQLAQNLRHTGSVDIRMLGPGDVQEDIAASHLFDDPADEGATLRFLSEEGHHLLIAYVDDHPAGFISGVEVTHPDKGTEMFLYELAVEGPFRRRGIGQALVERLVSLARARGCYGMWVLTDAENAGALTTYQRSGGRAETGQVMVVWTF